MLTIGLIREKTDFVIERLKIKNFAAEEIVRKILLLDSSRRDIQSKTDAMQGEMNRISREIGALMKAGKNQEADSAREKTYSSMRSNHSPINSHLLRMSSGQR
jgi:seryl-tRNA synthetase